MAVCALGSQVPDIHPSAYVHPGAAVPAGHAAEPTPIQP